MCAGGSAKMNLFPPRNTRQPPRHPWSFQELLQRRQVALGMALDTSSHATYSSALNSYLSFCDMHNFPIDPTQQTLSLFVVYMSAHIEPRSVANYLSGISHELEPFFPDVRNNRRSMLVARTLKGCKRLYSKPTRRKKPLPTSVLQSAVDTLHTDTSHDNKLFVAMLLTGFRGLLRLGEMTAHDSHTLRDPSKYSTRASLEWLNDGFAFWLRSHKTDTAFEGARIVVMKHDRVDAPSAVRIYLASRDTRFPFNPYLWVSSSGNVPTRHWFISHLRDLVTDTDFAGQSLRAGGATFLAELGVPHSIIQAIGRWSSETFQIYIRKNPVLLQVILDSRRSQTSSSTTSAP
jgi:hypothetical protein